MPVLSKPASECAPPLLSVKLLCQTFIWWHCHQLLSQVIMRNRSVTLSSPWRLEGEVNFGGSVEGIMVFYLLSNHFLITYGIQTLWGAVDRLINVVVKTQLNSPIISSTIILLVIVTARNQRNLRMIEREHKSQRRFRKLCFSWAVTECLLLIHTGSLHFGF